ncbi:hypothetical protein VNO77_44653 [Canavalia gladiata]|uniref:Uncharacterized protein n=1 Tax=Canavalia gladiata TaxID=3824 RepID=A0AAN9JXE7_CANGL
MMVKGKEPFSQRKFKILAKNRSGKVLVQRDAILRFSDVDLQRRRSPEPGPLLHLKIKGKDAVSAAISVAFQDLKAKTPTSKVTVQLARLCFSRPRRIREHRGKPKESVHSIEAGRTQIHQAKERLDSNLFSNVRSVVLEAKEGSECESPRGRVALAEFQRSDQAEALTFQRNTKRMLGVRPGINKPGVYGTWKSMEKKLEERGVVIRLVIGRSVNQGDGLNHNMDEKNRSTKDFLRLTWEAYLAMRRIGWQKQSESIAQNER